MLYDFIYVTFLKDNIKETENRSLGARFKNAVGWEGGESSYKAAPRGILVEVEWFVSWLLCSHINLRVIQSRRIKYIHVHTQMSARKPGNIWMKSLDDISVRSLAVTLYYIYAR